MFETNFVDKNQQTHFVIMVEPSILQYRLQKDQQMLKEVVDFY
jgi:hypothetical protein